MLGRNTRAATSYLVGSKRDPDHEATIRFSGEAPRRRAHSRYGFNAMAVFGSPPPRIMISGPQRTLKLDFLLLDQIV
jgi:hypothetical protein